ncbi:extracellular solute-binding protein [Paenibacillus sp. 1001270B_150601_E10]|uniref:extracellular solute-binding protein n=1 Tax=Paenibacillus sp. 1001270B_150601_E10 TaxID=2787079 RepID=UPI0018A0BE80|nr:extracellular solute-binding protein [Paenibacillus sp. 1001270B_150601_E10]
MKIKKALLSMLSVSLILLFVSACSHSGQQADGKSTAQSGDETSKKTLEFWSFYPERVKADSPGVTAIKEKFDVVVEFVPTTFDAYQEKLNLMIASKDIPDWMKKTSTSEYEKYMKQGIITEIPQELIETHMPKYTEWIKKYIDPVDPFKYVKRDGKIYGLPEVWDIGTDGTQLGIRQDWLAKVGIDKVPETLEEMEIILEKFRNEDPDGNGVKDTYGITAMASSGSIGGMFSFVFGAYGVHPGIFTEKDGKIVRGEMEPGAKEALTVLNRWYKNEWIDPEFVVNKDTNFVDKLSTNKAGAGEWYWWDFMPGKAFLGNESMFDKMLKADSNVKWATTGGIKGPSGDYGISQYAPADGSGIMFGYQLAKDQEKLIKYLQIFEATQFDPNLYELFNFGVEGTHWKRDENGVVQYIPPYDDQKERDKRGIAFGSYSMSGSFNDYEFQTSYTADKNLRELGKETRAKSTKIYDILNPYQKPVLNEYQDRLNQYTMETFIDFITGRKSLDEFDSYVQEWKKMGGDKVLEEAQKIYLENK